MVEDSCPELCLQETHSKLKGLIQHVAQQARGLTEQEMICHAQKDAQDELRAQIELTGCHSNQTDQATQLELNNCERDAAALRIQITAIKSESEITTTALALCSI